MAGDREGSWSSASEEIGRNGIARPRELRLIGESVRGSFESYKNRFRTVTRVLAKELRWAVVLRNGWIHIESGKAPLDLEATSSCDCWRIPSFTAVSYDENGRRHDQGLGIRGREAGVVI